MALGTSIVLNDRVSPALRNICNAVNQTINVMERLNNTMGDDINSRALGVARMEIINTRNHLNDFNNELVETSNNFDRVGRRGTSVFSRLGSTLKGYISVFASMQGVKWLVGVSDEMSQVNAKLNMINDTGYGVVRLNQAIFKTANDSRAVYSDMASQIAKLRMNTGNLFNTSEAIQFSSVLNKQFKIAGATVEETKNATTQLVQALGSGVLRGDELNSVFEAAPSILQAVADYMNVPIGKIRELASEGQITSQILKNALLDPQTVQKVNEDFSNIPITFGDLWTRAINNVKFGLGETSLMLNQIANNENMLRFVDNLTGMTQAISSVLVVALQGLATIGNFAYENWSLLAPVLTTVLSLLALYKGEQAIMWVLEQLNAFWTNAHALAMFLLGTATTETATAQSVLNGALYSCPLTWYLAMIMAVVGGFFLLIAVINKVTGANISAVGVIVGAWYGAGAIIQNIFFAICNVALMTLALIYNMGVAACTGVQNGFISMENTALSVFESVANGAIDLGNAIQRGILWGVNKAIDGLNALVGFANKLPGINLSKINHVGSNGGMSHVSFGRKAYKTPNYADISSSLFDYKNVGDAYNKGYGIGKNWKKYLFGIGKNNISDSMGNILNNALNQNNPMGVNSPLGGGAGGNRPLKGIEGNTAAILEEMRATGENIEYLRDLAAQSVINRYTRGDINIVVNNENNINSDMDIDGVAEQVTRKITETLENDLTIAEEGVHFS